MRLKRLVNLRRFLQSDSIEHTATSILSRPLFDRDRLRRGLSRMLGRWSEWLPKGLRASWMGQADRTRLVWRAIRDATVSLATQGRFAEADHMAERGLAVFPNDKEFLVQYALHAHHAGHHAVAVERWERALHHAPKRPICYAGLAANLRETGDFAKARTTLDDGLRRFPQDVSVLTEAARLAEAQGRFQDALHSWESACALPKPHPDWLQGRVQSLIMLGRFDEAKTALAAARAEFPDNAGVQALEGMLANAREDWPAAIRFWSEYRSRFPDDMTGWDQLGVALQGHELSKAAALTGDFVPDLPATIDIVENDAVRRLVLRFESLGDNCELGLVQRRYAAEPLGLLRWNLVQFDQLVEALRQRFRGMGEETNTELAVASNGEFYVFDRRWSLGMHTFLFAEQSNKELVHQRMCRRVTYLRDKLLSDLADAEKIFVYRSPGIDPLQLDVLHRALRDIGPVTLLAVQSIGSTSPFQGIAGDILRVDEQRFVGFLSRQGRDEKGVWNIAFDDWVSIFRKMMDVHSAGYRLSP